MQTKHRLSGALRWVLSALIVAAALASASGWGRAAEVEPVAPVLYAAWQPTGVTQVLLFRSSDQGASWEPLTLPNQATPVAWAGDEANRVAVSLSDRQVFSSEDRGKSWKLVVGDLPVLSLVWDGQGGLYLGTAGHGIYRQAAGGAVGPISAGQPALNSKPVSHLALVGGRLVAATPAALFYTDDGGRSWAQTQPVPGGISTLAAPDARTLLVGTAANGLFRSIDAGQTWQPASAGLGQEAAGLSLSITALQADPQESGVLYAAVSSLVGGTELHSAAMGTFITLDGGLSWQPMAGLAFPQAKPASALLPVSGRPLNVWSVAADGLQSYAPDVAGALVTLQHSAGDIQARATAARLLGLARTQEASGLLVAVMADPSPAVSQAAGEALGRIADPATATGLLLALQSPVPQVQRSAATALGMMRSEAAVDPLSAILLLGDPAMAGVAAQALGRIGSTGATQALLTALADAQMTTRRHAALGAIEALGEPAVSPLEEMLASANAPARSNAAEALGWIASPSSTAALVQAMGDSEPAVRAQAAWALGELAAPQARAALERAQARDRSLAVRQAAGQALTQFAEQPAVGTSLVASWALPLGRWETLFWLIPALLMLAAAWLLLSDRLRVLAPVAK